MKYITILDFMIKDLHLTGHDLLIYAIIYGFSQDEESQYTKGAEYLAEWCQITERQVNLVLNVLEQRNLINRTDNGISVVFNDKTEEIQTEQAQPETKPKATVSKGKDCFVEFAGNDKELLQTLQDFTEMRIKIRKPFTEYAKILFIKKLANIQPKDRIPVLQQSILNCWQDIYPLKSNTQFRRSDPGTFDSKGRYVPIHGCVSREQSILDSKTGINWGA